MSKTLGRFASVKKEFRSDGAVPPRCLVHLLLRRLGVKHLHALFWSDKDVRNLFEGELKLFAHWFQQCNACRAPKNRPQAYERLKKRIPMMKEDGLCSDTKSIPAIFVDTAWFDAVKRQTKPVVLNGLLACRALKKSILDAYGSRAMSLGTVGVESMWWQHHLRNINKASVWATPAWRQFHSVVALKKDVLCILRQCQDTVGGSRNSGWSQLLHELWYDLAAERRDLVDLPPRSGQLQHITQAQVNVGFCDYMMSVH